MNRTGTAVLGMLVAGLAGLAVVGWLMHVRMGRPLSGEPGPVGTFGSPEALAAAGEPDAEGLTALSAGGAYAVQIAQRALREGHTTDAARALDAADRISRIGMHAAASGGAAFELAHRLVQHARDELQNGAPAAAGWVLRDAGPAFASFRGGAAAPPAGELTAYAGATVINRHGVRIGQIDRVPGPGEPRQLHIRIGGWQNFMGFLDLGGSDVPTPVDNLVFGPAEQVGETLVALATR